MSEFFDKITDLITPDFKDFPDDTPKAIKPGISSYANVPSRWQWLLHMEQLPRIVAEGLKEYGTLETPGTRNNPVIIKWADEVAACHHSTYNDWAADWYNKDSVPWCGLYMAVIACRSAAGKANRFPVNSYLSALAWAGFGLAVDWRNLNNIICGDVAVFSREGGGHVGIIIGVSTDGKYLVVLGGNQSDAVNIKMISIARLYSVRRIPYNIQPLGAKHIRIDNTGVPISTREG